MIIQKQVGICQAKPVYKCTITNHNGLRLTCLSYGALWQKLELSTSSGWQNIVLSSPKFSDYIGKRHGASLGRVAGRIASGQTKFALPINEGRNTLHGGPHGFDTINWDTSMTAEKIIFKHHFTQAEDGFPGNMQVEITYLLTDEDAVEIIYDAVADAESLFNPTNHIYFNLNTADATIENHYLQIASSQHLELGATNIPTGKVIDNAGTVFDFRQARLLGTAISGLLVSASRGFDDIFILNNPSLQRPVATLTNGVGDLAIELFTDRNALVMYTANGWNKKTKLIDKTSRPYIGVALEMQTAPNAINQAEFGNINVAPNEPIQYRNRYVVKRK